MKNSNISEYGIYVPLEFEYFLSNIFDKKTYHGFVGSTTFKKWKETHKKLIKFLKDVIKKNIDSDTSHINHLNDLLNRYDEEIKGATTFDFLSEITLRYLYCIIFETIGNMPNNWNAKPQSRNKYLKKFRTISYSQNFNQKVNIIQNEISKYCELSSDDIWEKRLDFSLDSEKFIERFKENHPRIYCKLF